MCPCARQLRALAGLHVCNTVALLSVVRYLVTRTSPGLRAMGAVMAARNGARVLAPQWRQPARHRWRAAAVVVGDDFERSKRLAVAPPAIPRDDAPPPPPPAATQTCAAPEFQNTLLYNID